MPIYEYLCPCGRKFETLVLGATVAGPVCPKCGGSAAERLYSRFAAVGSSKSSGGGDFDGGDFGGGEDFGGGGDDFGGAGDLGEGGGYGAGDDDDAGGGDWGGSEDGGDLD